MGKKGGVRMKWPEKPFHNKLDLHDCRHNPYLTQEGLIKCTHTKTTTFLLPGCGMQLSGTGYEKGILKNNQQVGYSCQSCTKVW